jgi:hypothetical protein
VERLEILDQPTEEMVVMLVMEALEVIVEMLMHPQQVAMPMEELVVLH